VVVIVWLLDLQLPVQSVPMTTKVVSSKPFYGEVYSIQHYVIEFVSDLREVSGFLRALRFSSTNKTDRHDITEILLKVALSTINQPFIFIEIYHDKSRDIEFSAQESFVEYPSS
jgi:hypothetical protein